MGRPGACGREEALPFSLVFLGRAEMCRDSAFLTLHSPGAQVR